MYTIGQFALILKLSTRTLRHYDEIGLLKPQNINEENNYRYYGREQLGLGKSIVKLKEYGLSLEEIREILIKDTGQVVGLLYESISRNGLEVTGGHIIRYFGSEYDPENTEVEVCIPVESRKECKIKFGSIPKGRYVKASVNSIREKGDAYANIINWAQENDCIIGENHFEQYSINVQNKGFNVDIYFSI